MILFGLSKKESTIGLFLFIAAIVTSLRWDYAVENNVISVALFLIYMTYISHKTRKLNTHNVYIVPIEDMISDTKRGDLLSKIVHVPFDYQDRIYIDSIKIRRDKNDESASAQVLVSHCFLRISLSFIMLSSILLACAAMDYNRYDQFYNNDDRYWDQICVVWILVCMVTASIERIGTSYSWLFLFVANKFMPKSNDGEDKI